MLRTLRTAALLALAAFAGLAASPGVAAQGRPVACTAATVGQTVCQADGRCRCIYDRGGTLTNTRAGYRWDCSLLEGRCSAEALAAGIPVIDRSASPAAGGRQDRGRADVRAAQQALAARGFAPGPTDGVVGPRTRAALRAFQRSQGLAETGALNAETRRALGL